MVLMTGGISGDTRCCRTTRFCGLNLNSPRYVDTTANNNANSLLSVVLSGLRSGPRRSVRRSVPHFTIMNHPGTNGDDVVGTFVNRSEGVIARVTNAAHSDVCAHCSGFNFSFCLMSATNVHEGGGIDRSLRFCSMVHSVHTVRGDSIYVLVLSTAHNVRARSVGVFRLVRGGGGDLIIMIGG